MTRTFFTLRRIAIALAVQTAVAQQKCYYPNGNEAPEKPCSSAEGSACCPDKWECLDNGLCHYPPDNIWGRYSCTDQSWEAEGCPSNMCTYNMSAAGAESITQCSDHDNNWCCNADAQHVNCCAESPAPRPFFALADGKAYATIGTSTASSAPNLATITGKADGADTAPTPKPSATAGSNSPQPSTSAPSETPFASKEATPTTQLQTSLSSGSAGIVTVVRTQVITPTSPASTGAPVPTDPNKKSKLPIIIGCAVGIPLALAFLLILIWLLRKRSRQSKANNRVSKPPFADEILTDGSPTPAYGFAGGAKHNRTSSEKPVLTTYRSDGVTPVVPELAGQPVGSGRPMSTVHGRAELDSGGSPAPGTDMNSSWGTPELGTYHEADSRPISSVAQGAPPGGYTPYRPNNLVQPHQAQEMSTVTTPPVAELGMPSPPVAELRTVRT